MRIVVLLLACLALAGCRPDESPSSPPKFEIGDKVFVDGKLSLVINEPAYSSDGHGWVYSLYGRGHYFVSSEGRLELAERINWDEQPMPKLKFKLEDLFNPHGYDDCPSPMNGMPLIPLEPYKAPLQNKTTIEDMPSLFKVNNGCGTLPA